MSPSIQIDIEKPKVVATCPSCGVLASLQARFEVITPAEKKLNTRVRSLAGGPAFEPDALVKVACDACREIYLVAAEASLTVGLRVFEIRELTEVVAARAAEAEALEAKRMDAIRKIRTLPRDEEFLAEDEGSDPRKFDPEQSVDPLRDRGATHHYRIPGSGGSGCDPSCPACAAERKIRDRAKAADRDMLLGGLVMVDQSQHLPSGIDEACASHCPACRAEREGPLQSVAPFPVPAEAAIIDGPGVPLTINEIVEAAVDRVGRVASMVNILENTACSLNSDDERIEALQTALARAIAVVEAEFIAGGEETSVPPEKPEPELFESYRDPENRDIREGGDGRPR